MTTQINQLTELTTTSDDDLILIREDSTGIDKKMKAQNIRAKATTKDDVGLGNVDNVSAADLRDRSTHTGTQAMSTISDAGTAATADTVDLVNRANHTGTQTLATISDAGTIASQNANDVGITGGSVNADSLQQDGSQAYVRDNILGTVSQSAGVPTGAVIERDSNSDGEYVRFADGTQIVLLLRVINLNEIDSRSRYSQVGGNTSINYPKEFADVPRGVSFAGSGFPSLGGEEVTVLANAIVYSRDQSECHLVGTETANRQKTIRFMAIGRWF